MERIPPVRIIGGEFGGRRLRVPRGHSTRPTPDRVRVALFQVLADRLEGARVLELFGGTGSLGLEALSRGAAHATFAETDRSALACLALNISDLGVADRATLLPRSAFALPAVLGDAAPFDLLFCDPPFRMLEDAADRRRLEVLLAALPLAAGGRLVVEHRAGSLGDFRPPHAVLMDLRKWGSTGMAIYGLRPAPGGPESA